MTAYGVSSLQDDVAGASASQPHRSGYAGVTRSPGLGPNQDAAGAPARRTIRPIALATVLILWLLSLASPAAAQFFPFYDQHVSTHDSPTTETWSPWPFYSVVETTGTITTAVHPLFSWHRNTQTRALDFDILWPVYTHTYRPERGRATNYRSTYLFPLFFQREETRFGKQNSDRIILPFWFQGRQGDRGRYAILFPFIWYAYNAKLAVPLFPPREQTFAAFWPLIGDFRGYWNRDRIFFFLWPLYVYSSEGKGEGFNEVQSFLWPFFARYGGHNISGFRLWPLFAYTRKKDEYTRMFWLWPLGHHRSGRISRTNDEQQSVTMFIPFYARFRQPNVSLDLVFPFYGRLRVGERQSTGYLLAMYNREINFRQGTVEDRYFLFLFRRKRQLKEYEGRELEPDPNASLGGGFFPIYTRTYTPTRIRKASPWPIAIYKWNKYAEYEYERTYLFPFYANQRRTFNNGDMAYSRFVFPFFRKRQALNGVERTNMLHFFWYNDTEKIDRLYAPLWTYWQSRENVETGAREVRLFKNFSTYSRNADGTTRRRLSALLFTTETTRRPDGSKLEGKTDILFGALRRERSETEGRIRLLGMTLHRWPVEQPAKMDATPPAE